MMLNTMRIKYQILLFFMGIMSLPMISFAHADPLVPWYLYTFEVDQKTLPQELNISVAVDQSASAKTYALKLENKGDIPLYILKPQSKEPHYKLSSGKKYEYDFSNSTWIELSLPYFRIDENILRAYGIQIKNIYNDKRPLNAIPPTAQNFAIPASYAEKEFEIKGVVRFTLNPNYHGHPATSSSPVKVETASSTSMATDTPVQVNQTELVPVKDLSIFEHILNFFKKLKFW